MIVIIVIIIIIIINIIIIKTGKELVEFMRVLCEMCPSLSNAINTYLQSSEALFTYEAVKIQKAKSRVKILYLFFDGRPPFLFSLNCSANLFLSLDIPVCQKFTTKTNKQP